MSGKWNWSGSFTIDTPGDFGLRVYSAAGGGRYRILPLDVSLSGSSYLVTFGKEAERNAPYRIENRWAFFLGFQDISI